MNACADRQTESLDGVLDSSCAADGARRPVEGREEAVTGGIDLVAAEPFELPADSRVMALEKLAPTPVPHRGGPLCRADDVGEEDRREHPIWLRTPPRTGQELLHLVEDLVLVAEERQMIVTGSST